MCIIGKKHYFHSFGYSLILNLNTAGGVSGSLITSSDYNAIECPLQGCYINQHGLVKFAFTIDWSFPGAENWGFTCFSGHFVNSHILIMDWMLVENKTEDNFGTTGSDYLHSSLSLNERRKLPNNIRPFPLEIELLKCVRTLM
jgi:hypothetical protein